MADTIAPGMTSKLDQLERRLRQLQEEFRIQVEITGVLRGEILKLLDRMAKLEKARTP